MQWIVRRIGLLAFIIIVSFTLSVTYSRLVGDAKYFEVKISYPESTENMSMEQALMMIATISQKLEDIALNHSEGLGISLGEAVSFIEEAEKQTEEMWSVLEEEVVKKYLRILDMVFLLNNAWVNPSNFKESWFEKPSDAETYAEFANRLNISEAEILDDHWVDIQLEANRSLSLVTYTANWTTSKGQITVTRTHVLVREDSLWKFRHLDVQLDTEGS